MKPGFINELLPPSCARGKGKAFPSEGQPGLLLWAGKHQQLLALLSEDTAVPPVAWSRSSSGVLPAADPPLPCSGAGCCR